MYQKMAKKGQKVGGNSDSKESTPPFFLVTPHFFSSNSNSNSIVYIYLSIYLSISLLLLVGDTMW